MVSLKECWKWFHQERFLLTSSAIFKKETTAFCNKFHALGMPWLEILGLNYFAGEIFFCISSNVCKLWFRQNAHTSQFLKHSNFHHLLEEAMKMEAPHVLNQKRWIILVSRDRIKLNCSIEYKIIHEQILQKYMIVATSYMHLSALSNCVDAVYHTSIVN